MENFFSVASSTYRLSQDTLLLLNSKLLMQDVHSLAGMRYVYTFNQVIHAITPWTNLLPRLLFVTH